VVRVGVVLARPVVMVALRAGIERRQLLEPALVSSWRPGSSSLMNTLAVMCIAFTRQSPSLTPLSRTAFSTSGVMFTNSIRAGISSVSVLRRCFMGSV